MSTSRPDNEPSRIEVSEIEHDSSCYHEVLTFRERILRQPLGLQLTTADTAAESEDRHFVISKKGRILGGVIARDETESSVRLRQMWIDPDHDGQGLGRSLLDGVLEKLSCIPRQEVTLHARLPVVGFYEKCGFRPVGDTFDEVGIPHRKMTRSLSLGTRSPGDHQ